MEPLNKGHFLGWAILLVALFLAVKVNYVLLWEEDWKVFLFSEGPLLEIPLLVFLNTVDSIVPVHGVELSVAPSEPNDVTAVATSSTSVTVTWTEPSMPNGLIRRYIITYYRTDSGLTDSQEVNITSNDTTTAVLSGLDIFTNYTIFVEAVTVATGDMSERVTVMTDEDGESSKLHVLRVIFDAFFPIASSICSYEC